MEWSDIIRRARAGEDEHTELKRGADLKQLGPALCAFANTDGGIVVLGGDDGHEVKGVSEPPERVRERLTAFLQSGLSEPLRARLGYHADPAGPVHWIEVFRQRGPQPLQYGGRVYVRRGRASVPPSPAELQDLYNTFGFVLTEEQGVPGTSAASIEPHAFRSYLAALGLDIDEEPQPTLEEDLRNRGILVDIGGELVCSLYGLLAFGRDPQGTPPTQNLWVECVAYAGTDRAAEVIQVADARGRVDEQVERALGWARSLGRSETYDGVRRVDHPRVPVRALREALVNAVAHRDYAIMGAKILLEAFDDRVCVTSPGVLPNHLRPESVRAGGLPRSRNELIANLFLTKRLMEKRGRGWPIMRKEMLAHNGTEPLLDEDRGGGFVRVTFLAPANVGATEGVG